MVKQQKCDTVSHKQHQAAKLAQNKSALTHSQTPMPQQYADFDDEKIQLFSINLGFQIDVIYIESLGVWSFRIVEPDMGANIGTPKEREAVSGRTFTTEIAFRKQDDCVEIGMRTICSEPSDNTQECEVFRPSVVKALAENTDSGQKVSVANCTIGWTGAKPAAKDAAGLVLNCQLFYFALAIL